MAVKISSTMADLIFLAAWRAAQLLWALPITTQVILMFFEGIRTIPGEIRMMMRIHRRGRPNIVEIIFFVIKVCGRETMRGRRRALEVELSPAWPSLPIVHRHPGHRDERAARVDPL